MQETQARLTEADAVRAESVWTEYQRTHDISGLIGQTAGIDPDSGRIWIGDSIIAVADQRNSEGIDKPLHFVRIGYATYYRKGARR